MKKKFSKNYWLVLIMFLTIIGTETHAQQLEYPSAKDAVTSVLWELAKGAAKIHPGPAMALSAMEILTIDSQAYGDVARGLYWVDNANRQYEYNWGDRVVHAPRGAELRDTLVEFKKAGFLTEKEINEVRDVLNTIRRNDLRINQFPKSVQDKINAALKVSISTNRSEIIKNVIAKAKKKQKAASCKDYVGKWAWANGGVTTFSADGQWSWKRGAGKVPAREFNTGSWECRDEIHGIVYHKADHGGYEGCYKISVDGNSIFWIGVCDPNAPTSPAGTRIK